MPVFRTVSHEADAGTRAARAISYCELIKLPGRVGVGTRANGRQRRKGGIVSMRSRQGGVGRARWTLASVSAVGLVLALGACNGDDDAEELSQAASELSAAQDQVDVKDASLDDANETITSQESQIDDLNDQVETANQAASDTKSEKEAETERADKAESDLAALQQQVDDVKAEFPVTLTASLEPYTDDLVGGYTMTLTQAYCDALPTCDQNREPVHADIIQGPNGLQLQIPNVFTTGLFMVEGSLFGVTDSDQLAGPCPDGNAINAQVSITIFASGVAVDVDGTEALSGLGASLIVTADPVGSCEAGTIFFASTLTPD